MTEPLKLRHLVKRRYRFRSAKTGLFVSRAYALCHPFTTVSERVR